MKMLLRLAIAGAAIVALMQLVRPKIPAAPATAEISAPPQVRQILDRSCYSCHSNERRLAWFDQIEPGYWLVRKDILTAREHLNFSTIGSKPTAAQKAALYESVNMIQLGAMPLPRFLALHREARVTPEELETIKAYLAPWGALPSEAESGESAQAPASLAAVQPEPGGFPFDATFESWKPISFTDRGDNNTFRFVLGNEIAIEAARSGNISPWPDGARFAKIAWQQRLGADGLVYPGNFVQVELMAKNAGLYRNTDGWGWGRWRGLELKPYGKGALFVEECTTCHMPVRGNDSVYTLPITSARVRGEEVVNNAAAALPANLPYQPLAWSAITMYVDRNASAVAVLYGNAKAMEAVHARSSNPDEASGPAYPAGSVLALVAWGQRDDPHWFGARIPDAPRSVEFVQIAGQESDDHYQRYAGTKLTEDLSAASRAAQRMHFMLTLKPARMP
jgi:mono/diheme cytochrome c family protein